MKFKILITSIALSAVALAGMQAQGQAECLSYWNPVSLTGIVVRSVARGDQPETQFVIRLDHAVCVNADPRDEFAVAVASIKDLQLIPPQDTQLHPQLGKYVTLGGQLIPAVTRHHNTRVLLADALTIVPETKPTARSDEIALESEHGGGWRLPVTVNQTLTVPFILDTGATSVVIPSDVYSVLHRQGTVGSEDARDTVTAIMADGSQRQQQCFLIHELKVGDKTITNVRGCVGPIGSDPLLGQAFLKRLGGYRVDNQRHVLILD